MRSVEKGTSAGGEGCRCAERHDEADRDPGEAGREIRQPIEISMDVARLKLDILAQRPAELVEALRERFPPRG